MADARSVQIEAAARAIRKVVADRIWSQTDMTPTAWDDLKPFQRDGYRAEAKAKAALEAAEQVAPCLSPALK